MDWSVVLQVVANFAIIAIIVGFIVVKLFGVSNKISSLKDDFIRWRHRYSKW